MLQHTCGTLLDDEDLALGICPGCLEYLAAASNPLGNFSLAQLTNLLCPNQEILENSSNSKTEDKARIVIDENPEDITLNLNHKTGAYEVEAM